MGVEVLISLLSVFITLAIGAIGAFFRWLYNRRQNSGKIQTSSADILWEQAQQMREMLLTEKRKAEDQRDRLFEGQSSMIIPALNSIDRSLKIVLKYIEELRNGGYDHSSQKTGKPGEDDDPAC